MLWKDLCPGLDSLSRGQDGEFGPPMQVPLKGFMALQCFEVFDQDSQFEAQLWQQVLYQERPLDMMSPGG